MVRSAGARLAGARDATPAIDMSPTAQPSTTGDSPTKRPVGAKTYSRAPFLSTIANGRPRLSSPSITQRAAKPASAESADGIASSAANDAPSGSTGAATVTGPTCTAMSHPNARAPLPPRVAICSSSAVATRILERAVAAGRQIPGQMAGFEAFGRGRIYRAAAS
jgi:hypothetical protein